MKRMVHNRFTAAMQLLLMVTTASAVTETNPGVVSFIPRFFADGFIGKGFGYAFGGRSSFEIRNDEKKRYGSVLAAHFDDREASAGIGIGLAPEVNVDCSTLLELGALRMRVRGERGGERFNVGILDTGTDGSNKVTVLCRSSDWCTVRREWQNITIPLSAFARDGVRWYDREKAAELAHVNWHAVSAVSFSTEKEANFGCSGEERIATVYFDDIELVRLSPDEHPQPLFAAWGLRGCSGAGPAVHAADATTFFCWLSTAPASYTSVYLYGEPTDFRLCSSDTAATLPTLDVWFSDNEWSGVTLYRPGTAAVDLSSIRESGAIVFSVRGETGGEQFNIGILDDASDGVDRNVQSMVRNTPYCTVNRSWQEVVIPLADFPDFGKWWHSDAHYEVNGKIDWRKIAQLRFSTDKNGNARITGDGTNPVAIHFADIRFTSGCTAFSSIRYWKTFSSNVADRMIDDFNKGRADSGWTAVADPRSGIELSTVTGEDGTPALAITHSLAEWGSVSRDFADSTAAGSNWSEHAGIRCDIRTDGAQQRCDIMVIDSGNEAWCAPVIAGNEWQTVTVPFARFRPFEWWQPDVAIRNNRMDLRRVRRYMFRPELKGNNAVVMVDNVVLTNRLPSHTSSGGSLFVNQAGYERTMPKRFLCRAAQPQPFALFDDHGSMIYSGTAEEGGAFPLAGGEYRSGSFTAVQKNGTYSLVLQESGEKQQVLVGEGVYRMPFDASLKAFYFQRSGCTLDAKYAGKWARTAGHPDTACPFHSSTGHEGVADVHGGWYDAGDYGKYVVPAGITVATLLALYELFPKCVGDATGIPESGNGVSDLLDEARYEIEWMLRMQDEDGGVFFKVGTLQWDGFTMPIATPGKRYIIGKSTASTLETAAVLAMAARLYKDADRRFAHTCLKGATAAWKWAVAHPALGEPKESGGTGAYGDSRFQDEFFHAASELFCTTGKGIYRSFIENNAQLNEVKGPAGWNDVGNLGVFSLCRNNAGVKGIEQLRRSLLVQADRSADAIEAHPCRIPTEQFIWGSNSYLLNHAVILSYAFRLTGKRRYLERVQDVADYIFGVNPTGYSFVTGFGKRSPQHPHHRIMGADTVDDPIPGFLVGGPNGGREDENREAPGVYYPNKEPALAYVDLQGAYASNEVAINWNAPLVFVLGYLKEGI